MPTSEVVWRLGKASWMPCEIPRLMGIVNVTPDSFSDGGRFLDNSTAIDHACALEEQGADILDIGGESTRPGATPVPLEEELRRVIPVIQSLSRRVRCLISIDTYKAAVAEAAVAAGAAIINDISGLTFDPEMLRTCAACDAGVIVMHIQGTPQTMQQAPRYTAVVDEILAFFEERLATLEAAGVAPERVALDPGIGFGKTAQHNLEILGNIARFRSLGRPVLIGHSRKRFLKKILDTPLDEFTAGTIGVSVALAEQGVDLLRVHDVAATRDALVAWNAVRRASSGGTP